MQLRMLPAVSCTYLHVLSAKQWDITDTKLRKVCKITRIIFNINFIQRFFVWEKMSRRSLKQLQFQSLLLAIH